MYSSSTLNKNKSDYFVAFFIVSYFEAHMYGSPDHSHEGKRRQREVPRHQRPAEVHGFPLRHHLGPQVAEQEVCRADEDGQPGAIPPQPQPALMDGRSRHKYSTPGQEGD